MQNRIWSVVCVSVLLGLGTGCSSVPSDPSDEGNLPSADQSAGPSQSSESTITLPSQVIWSSGPKHGSPAADPQTDGSPVGDLTDQPPVDEQPNAIMLATCESEPDEVAVPLNAFDDRFCDTVQAIAYRSDDTGSYPVSADYTWSIADESVAVIRPLPGQESRGIQRPSAQYDIFWAQDQTQEPTTVVTVCAQPKGGWSDPQHPPLCRTLSLHDVINLDGAWCFTGATFQDDCGDTLPITQDGRFLRIASNGQGVLYATQIQFYRGDYFYQAEIATHDAMVGTVEQASTHEVIGNWQAWHLPLP